MTGSDSSPPPGLRRPRPPRGASGHVSTTAGGTSLPDNADEDGALWADPSATPGRTDRASEIWRVGALLARGWKLLELAPPPPSLHSPFVEVWRGRCLSALLASMHGKPGGPGQSLQ